MKAAVAAMTAKLKQRDTGQETEPTQIGAIGLMDAPEDLWGCLGGRGEHEGGGGSHDGHLHTEQENKTRTTRTVLFANETSTDASKGAA
jgi:hypothetical protein